MDVVRRQELYKAAAVAKRGENAAAITLEGKWW